MRSPWRPGRSRSSAARSIPRARAGSASTASGGLGGTGTYGAAALDGITAALGLEKSPAEERRAEIIANLPAFERVVADRIDLSLRVLDEVMADPKRRITVHDVSGLRSRIDALSDRAPRMVETVGRALANGPGAFETARVLQGVLAHLPADRFDAVADPLLAIIDAQPTLGDRRVDLALAVRFGRMGARALPALERLVFQQPRRPDTAALYGLCRVGADAAPLAERILALGEGAKRRDGELETAIYVTLLRLGREDLIEREKAAGKRFQKLRPRLLARTITPASPPEECFGENRWPDVPA